jgi:L-malate glycosyltransferase
MILNSRRGIMKILLVSNMYPSKEAPNYGVFVKNTENILVEEGYSVDRIVLTKMKGQFKKLVKYSAYFSKIMLSGMFKKYDIIYVHYATHNSIPLLILKALNPGVKICVNVHGSDVVPEFKKRYKYQKYVSRLLQVSDIVITPSEYYKDLVSSKYNLSKDKLRVFPSGGVNKNVFYQYDRKDETGEKYLGYVGRLDYKKGWEVYLEFIKKSKEQNLLPGYKYILVGNGDDADKYRELVKKYGIESFIIKHNLLSQDELRDIYNSIELFVFPTMREGESLGLVGLEAMACGTPVVGSYMGGLKDYIIDGYNGYFFTPGSSEGLMEKIMLYVNKSDDGKNEIRKNAVKTAEKYEVNNIKKKLVAIFSELDESKE